MDATVVGIDVSKDRLDVHVLPSHEAFSVERDAAGLDELVRRLLPLLPAILSLLSQRLQNRVYHLPSEAR